MNTPFKKEKLKKKTFFMRTCSHKSFEFVEKFYCQAYLSKKAFNVQFVLNVLLCHFYYPIKVFFIIIECLYLIENLKITISN